MNAGVDGDGISPLFVGEMDDGSAAAGLCNPFATLDEPEPIESEG